MEACGESIGYLPGSASEKVAGYMLPLFENIQEYTGSHMDSIRPQLQIAPLSFIRGRTFKNCAVVMDEAQNASLKQLKLFITRLGRGSRMILCGDSEQSDIRFSALRATAEEFASVTGCCHYHFSSTASMARHPLMPDIIDTFDKLEAKHGYQTHA